MSEYVEFGRTWADLKATEELVGLEVTVQSKGSRGSPRRSCTFVETFLVGHVNADDAGCCGCCSSVRDDTLVLRYRRVYDPSKTPPSSVTDDPVDQH